MKKHWKFSGEMHYKFSEIFRVDVINGWPLTVPAEIFVFKFLPWPGFEPRTSQSNKRNHSTMATPQGETSPLIYEQKVYQVARHLLNNL